MNALEVFGVIGIVIFCLWLALLIAKGIYIYGIRASRTRNAIRKEKGRWALITGATDGIGKAYARALAKRGLHVILVSRDPQKLNNCAEEITHEFAVDSKVIAVDFTHDLDIYDNIKQSIEGLEIGVLVNNVGISYTHPEYFLDIPNRDALLPNLIKANILSVTKMCEVVMPQMLNRASGVVINISSLSASIPSPFLTAYAATKSYVEKFSDDLRYEYADKGIIIQTVLPGYVATKMSGIRKSNIAAPSPEVFVESALRKVGIHDHTAGYWVHSLMILYMDMLQYLCRPLAIQLVRNAMKDIRKRALARANKTSAVQES